MPQDGSNNYQYPLGTPGIPDQTIESEAYNTFLDDLVVNDLNWPRPVHRGGTGASTAAGARDNLDVEVAQQLVTNYDSHVFEAGSFYSNPGATGEPVAGQYFSGVCYIVNSNTMHIEGRVFSGSTAPGAAWGRAKAGGVWGAWTSETAALDSRFVKLAGDTMTGMLTINTTNPSMRLQQATAGQAATIASYIGSSARWQIDFGDGSSESGGNAGSNFVVRHYNDAGGGIGAPLVINRQTGLTTVTNLQSSTGRIVTGQATSNAAVLFSGSTGSYSIYASNDGRLTFGNVSGSDPAGSLGYFQSSGTYKFVVNDAANIGTNLLVGGTIMVAGSTIYMDAPAGNKYIYVTGNNIAIGGADLMATVDAYKPGGGAWLDSNSDARVKNVEGEYTRSLDDIVALRPVYYTFKGNDTFEAPGYSEALDAKTETITVPYPNSPHHAVAVSGKKFAGLIAQEVEAVFPEIVIQRSGYIDGVAVTDMRTLDTSPLVFALINAVKELKARVEQLEAA